LQQAFSNQSINQSIKTHSYSTMCRKRIRDVRCHGLDRVFTVSSVKQLRL